MVGIGVEVWVGGGVGVMGGGGKLDGDFWG
jgi:hypothetical protein